MNKNLREFVGRDRKLCSLTDRAFRLWVCALGAFDAFGLMRADPWEFKTDAAPGLPVTDDESKAALDELEAKRLIHRYKAEGHCFLLTHDHFDHNPHLLNLVDVKPRYPVPPAIKCSCMEKWQKAFAASVERRSAKMDRMKKGRDGNGKHRGPLSDPLKELAARVDARSTEEKQ